MNEWAGVRDKRVVITGATNGIGLAAAKELAKRGANLAIVARSEPRGRAAAERIGGDVDVLHADLASQESVRTLAGEIRLRYPRVDVLVNNAGVINASRSLTVDGIEETWAVNHFAPFLLTTALLDRLKESAPSRIVNTASGAHHAAKEGIPFGELEGERPWTPRSFRRYGETKLANILFTSELARRLEGTGVTANCFHPGFVATGLGRNNGVAGKLVVPLLKPFARSPRKGAETLVWLVDSPEASDESGGYFYDMRRIQPTAWGRDTDAAERLWDISEEQTRAGAERG